MSNELREEESQPVGGGKSLDEILDEIWSISVDPHALKDGSAKKFEEDWDEGKTMVPAQALPKGAVQATGIQLPDGSDLDGRTIIGGKGNPSKILNIGGVSSLEGLTIIGNSSGLAGNAGAVSDDDLEGRTIIGNTGGMAGGIDAVSDDDLEGRTIIGNTGGMAGGIDAVSDDDLEGRTIIGNTGGMAGGIDAVSDDDLEGRTIIGNTGGMAGGIDAVSDDDLEGRTIIGNTGGMAGGIDAVSDDDLEGRTIIGSTGGMAGGVDVVSDDELEGRTIIGDASGLGGHSDGDELDEYEARTIISESRHVDNSGSVFGTSGLSLADNIGSSRLPMKTPSTPSVVRAAKALAGTTISSMRLREKIIADSANQDPAKRMNQDSEYELGGLLGEGGMGVVYDARQTSIGRDIALKLIKPDLALDPGVQAVFLAEAAVTGDLEHPNIVPIYEMGIQEGGLLFYSMKKTSGRSWDTVIKGKSEEENVEILMKVCDAIAYAHSKGIIHRDLKPENISLGDFGEVLVMDWGLAVSVEDAGRIGKATKMNAAGGTPGYMSPEMVLGDLESLGVPSDIYLLGAILFELLSGLRPHSGKKIRELLTNIAKNVIVSTDRDDELMSIAMKAMAAKSSERHQSVQEFQEAIRNALEHSESIGLTKTAALGLSAAVANKEYECFSQAMFGFREALNMWSGNVEAQKMERAARIAYAKAALEKGDLDLAESLIAKMTPAAGEVQAELDLQRAAKKSRDARFKFLKYASASLVAIVIAGLSISYVLVEAQRREAETARLEAKKQQGRAELGEKAAVAAMAEVEKAKKVIEKQHGLTLVAKEEAVAQREQAEIAKDEAEVERKNALAAKDDAERQRVLAVKSEEDALRQRQEAVKAKEDAERQRVVADAQRKQADEQRKIAQEHRELAEASLVKLQRIGELKKRIKQSLTTEESKVLQANAARQAKQDVFKSVLLGEVPLDMALIPAGEFVMGSDIDEEGRVGEEYLHTVCISDAFFMGRKELTQAQWLAVMGTPSKTHYDPSADAELPVVNVSFNQFNEQFLGKLNAFAPKGYKFRLPTEAEWEYACRAGSYSDFQAEAKNGIADVAWYRANSGNQTHPTGMKKANVWGLYDMHGNVTEMCGDYYARNFYLTSKKDNPFNATHSDYRIARGGSWISLPLHFRSAYRSFVHPTNQYKYMGFRLVLVKE